MQCGSITERNALMLLALCLAGLIFFVSRQSWAGIQNISPEELLACSQYEVSRAKPVLIHIGVIDVTATIVNVGLTQGGLMDVPAEPAQVGWYACGPKPGEKGSAVIGGHYGWKDDIPTAFDKLDTLVAGDKIVIVDEAGVSTTFTVKRTQIFNSSEETNVVFQSSDNKAHLNLITCAGPWNKQAKNYPKRLVLFSDRE